MHFYTSLEFKRDLTFKKFRLWLKIDSADFFRLFLLSVLHKSFVAQKNVSIKRKKEKGNFPFILWHELGFLICYELVG